METLERYLTASNLVIIMKLVEFQKQIKKQKLDLIFLVDQDINITYFTQFKPSFSILTIYPQKVELYLTSLDQKPKLKNIIIKPLKKGWEKKLFNVKINKKVNNVKKVGINKGSITVSYLEKLKKIFPKAKFVDVASQMRELRTQKTDFEIKLIKKACQITDFAFSELVKELKKSKLKTEKEVAFYLEQKMAEKGAEPAFPTIVAMGKNAAVPHHVTSNSKLKRGFLLLDFGAKYKNYCSDMSRVLFLGTARKSEKETYNLLLSAQEKAINNIKLGTFFVGLDKYVRKNLGKYSSYFIHSLGHGVGLDIHESPSFIGDQKQQVQEGQIFTIEPGIYFPGKYGLRIEDTILFAGKPEILTKSSKTLIEISGIYFGHRHH